MRIIIGIDDTDNLESRGTGFRARQLGQLLTDSGLAQLLSITRHQLLVDERIPYTSHNSSASILCETRSIMEEIIKVCRHFLLSESAEGSDAGLCVAELGKIDKDIIDWGKRAKKEVLSEPEAIGLSSQKGIYLEGLCGEKTGIIGALAAIGLRAQGNDGRLLWLSGLRELSGIHTIPALKANNGIEKVCDLNGKEISAKYLIEIGEFCRPVHINGKITLFVEKSINNGKNICKTASKEFVKGIDG